MSKKSEYEKGWYDCYKNVRSLLNESMKEMVKYRTPGEELKVPETVVSASIRRRARRGNGKEAKV